MPKTPFLLIPGVNSTAAVFSDLIPALWPYGPVSIANHTEGDSLAAIAANILRDAPPRFALLGFSLGGYLCFEILRQAPERVIRLCLLDTSARPDTAESTAKRRENMAKARAGRFAETLAPTFALAVHPDHAGDEKLRAFNSAMSLTVGPEVYLRHQEAIIARVDSRPDLPGIKVPTLVIVGDADEITVPDAAREMAAGIPGAKLVVIETAGHMALLEQPQVVIPAIVDWARG